MKKLAVVLAVLFVLVLVGSAAADSSPEMNFEAAGIDVQLKIYAPWTPVKPGEIVPIYPPPCPPPDPLSRLLKEPDQNMHCFH